MKARNSALKCYFIKPQQGGGQIGGAVMDDNRFYQEEKVQDLEVGSCAHVHEFFFSKSDFIIVG